MKSRHQAQARQICLDLYVLEGELRQFSQLHGLWDSIPNRFFWGRQEDPKAMSVRTFRCFGRVLTSTLIPGSIRVKREDGDEYRFYRPGVREKLVLDALVHLASKGKVDMRTRNGEALVSVTFSLYELRKELAARKHTYNLDQIKAALETMKRSSLKIEDPMGEFSAEVSMLYEYSTNRKGRCYVLFNSLLSRDIRQLRFRRFNYCKAMECSQALARWILKRISLRFLQASPAEKWSIRLSTIQEESPMGKYARTRDALKKVQAAFDELFNRGVITESDIEPRYEGKDPRKITDALCWVRCTSRFCTEMKRSNQLSSQSQRSLPTGSNRVKF
jgi:hypothetical protein